MRHGTSVNCSTHIYLSSQILHRRKNPRGCKIPKCELVLQAQAGLWALMFHPRLVYPLVRGIMAIFPPFFESTWTSDRVAVWPYCHSARHMTGLVMNNNDIHSWDGLQWSRKLERFEHGEISEYGDSTW